MTHALHFRRTRQALLVTAALSALSASAADSPVIVGKDDWLFYRFETASTTDQAAINQTLDLIQRVNKSLARNGTAMVFTMAPLKMRIHSQHLPASFPLTDFLSSHHDKAVATLRQQGVKVADMNTVFLKHPDREGPVPLYRRLDTHWSPAGALVGAKVVKDAIAADPALSAALAETKKDKITLVKEKAKPAAGDLQAQLPQAQQTYGTENIVSYAATHGNWDNLTGEGPAVGVALVGSSYSAPWTSFGSGIRYELQRNVLSTSVPADQGSWVGLESYLRDESFQSKRPKLLIWEMPERDLRAAPNYPYRPAAYVQDNAEWLARAGAWIEKSCTESPVTVAVDTAGLVGSAKPGAGGPTKDGGYVELNLSATVDRTDYLSMRLLSAGSTQLTLEASGPSAAAKRWTVTVGGDDQEHVFKTPLIAKSGAFNKLRILPGNTKAFALKNVQVCKQSPDLYK